MEPLLLTGRYSKRKNAMAWGIVLLCIVLGSFSALRPSGRLADFRRAKAEE